MTERLHLARKAEEGSPPAPQASHSFAVLALASRTGSHLNLCADDHFSQFLMSRDSGKFLFMVRTK